MEYATGMPSRRGYFFGDSPLRHAFTAQSSAFEEFKSPRSR